MQGEVTRSGTHREKSNKGERLRGSALAHTVDDSTSTDDGDTPRLSPEPPPPFPPPDKPANREIEPGHQARGIEEKSVEM